MCADGASKEVLGNARHLHSTGPEVKACRQRRHASRENYTASTGELGAASRWCGCSRGMWRLTSNASAPSVRPVSITNMVRVCYHAFLRDAWWCVMFARKPNPHALCRLRTITEVAADHSRRPRTACGRHAHATAGRRARARKAERFRGYLTSRIYSRQFPFARGGSQFVRSRSRVTR